MRLRGVQPRGWILPLSLLLVAVAVHAATGLARRGQDVKDTSAPPTPLPPGPRPWAKLTKDINKIPTYETGSFPGDFVGLGGITVFSAYSTATGQELWRTDGTDAGTVLVKDINPGPYGSASDPDGSWRELTEANGTLFFRAYDFIHGWELWRTDGTEAGTVLVKDINPDSGSYPNDLTEVDGTLFFTADDGIHGYELWKSDGTEAGTVLVKDINPGRLDSYSYRLTEVNGTLFFIGLGGLWKSDGTGEGTVLVKAVGALGLSAVNGTLFFTVLNGIHGDELWKSDGTEAGTVLVKDIPDAPYPYPYYPYYIVRLTAVNGTLFFIAYNVFDHRELWKSDGTEAGTVLVKDGVYPYELTAVNGTLFYNNPDGLWKSDGTEAGTVLVKKVGGYELTAVNGTLFFRNPDGLWKSDGTEAGTVLVRNVGASKLTAVNGTLFFEAWDSIHGGEPWKSDGTDAGTVLVKDINPFFQTRPSQPTDEGELIGGGGIGVGGEFFFAADAGTRGEGLWKSDGTEAGTVLVKDGVYPYEFATLNGTLFITTAYALLKSDGTEAGTVLVKDGWAFDLAAVKGTLFFNGFDEIHGSELWKSDGTEAGTVLVKDIRPGASDSDPQQLVEVNGTLFFSAHDGIDGGLWKSDGTEAGTVLVKDIYPLSLTAVNGTLLFGAYDDAHGVEPWRSDGTENGTVMIQDIAPGPASSLVGQEEPFTTVFIPVGNRVFFAADDGVSGIEPWVGSAAILVNRPKQAVQDLRDEVKALRPTKAIERTLTAKLDAAAKALARPDGNRDAIRALEEFIREVEAQSPMRISEEAAASLIEFAQEIVGLLDD